jgi:putative salt-induced outer membrane protein YdiY
MAATLSIALSASTGRAQEGEPAESERPWSNSADLSLVLTSGNSSVTTLSLTDKLTHRWSRSQVVVEALALKTRTEERELINVGGRVEVQERSRTTAEEYSLGGRYRYRFYEGIFAFASLGWQRNELAGIENRYTVASGLGYQVIDTDRTKIAAEAGADWTREDPVDTATEGFVGAQIRALLERQLTGVAKIDSELELLENLEETDDLRINWLASVTASLSEVFAIKLSYQLRFDNQPVVEILPPDSPGEEAATFTFDETDTRFSASLVVNL